MFFRKKNQTGNGNKKKLKIKKIWQQRKRQTITKKKKRQQKTYKISFIASMDIWEIKREVEKKLFVTIWNKDNTFNWKLEIKIKMRKHMRRIK